MPRTVLPHPPVRSRLQGLVPPSRRVRGNPLSARVQRAVHPQQLQEQVLGPVRALPRELSAQGVPARHRALPARVWHGVFDATLQRAVLKASTVRAPVPGALRGAVSAGRLLPHVRNPWAGACRPY